MKLKKLLSKFSLDKLKINTHFLSIDLSFNDVDKKAAWELYVELLTRIATQYLNPKNGDEKTALTSIFSLFKTTRTILKQYGPECIEFSKIAIVVLNQVVRPFTAKWHKESLNNAFENLDKCNEFREELLLLQKDLRNYTKLLSEIAGVEDLTQVEIIEY